MKFFAIIIFSIALVAGCATTMFSSGGQVRTKADLGRMLFNDTILSLDKSVSCASCHKPEFAFSDTSALSKGIFGTLTFRNTPSVLNMKSRPYYFWDGRATSLEEQSLMPIENPDEMGLPIDSAVKRLNESATYNHLFRKIFKQHPDRKNLAAAFAAFERTLETVDSKFDDWANGLAELSPEEERGRLLFTGSKAKCFECHFMEDFTDDRFKNIGLYDGLGLKDVGRFGITKDSADLGKFKTPGLRNIAVTGPYMHNGMFETLDQVLAYYNTPGHFVDSPINIDSSLSKPLGLTPAERKDIVAFLKTLTDKAYLKQVAE